ncbi:MAG: ATP-dependent Clp protease proteolytic subunit, partial [Actinomycetota bacterium]|nr:ATP-dependent Clp protease proteolytic subunit [Actinomycetota bacterium]
MRRLLEHTLAHHTGQSEEQVRKDIDRDKILTSPEAKDYGIIDDLTQVRKLSAVRP